MDYLQLQADARAENRNLLLVFSVIIAVVAATAAAVVTASAWGTLRLIEVWVAADAESAGRQVAESEVLADRLPWGWVYLTAFVFVASVISWVSYSREQALVTFGGAGIARSLGGRRIDGRSGDSAERRFVNAVEEMSIAARRPAPAVFVLDGEPGINAFNAGWTDETTAIGITSGALGELKREELQAVAAQAMSHVFHGDARLNLRLMALVTGVAGLAMIGEDWIERAMPEGNRSDDRGPFLPLLIAGSLLYGVGWIGAWLSSMVQRSVARRHELLADATAIELLRQSEPMRDALRRLGGHPAKSRIRHRKARSINHLFMADAGGRRGGGLHPDLHLRVLCLDASWTGDWLRPDTSDHVSPNGPAPVAATPAAPAVPEPPSSSGVPGLSAIPGLEPIAPVFDAMSAAVPGLSVGQAGSVIGAAALSGSPASTGAGAGLLEPMITTSVMAAALDPHPTSAIDGDRARTILCALVHHAAGLVPTDSSVAAPCSTEGVVVALDVLRRSPTLDRPALVAEAASALTTATDAAAFAHHVVAPLRVDDDLDQWMLRRLVIGHLVAVPAPKKRRALERLRGEYAMALSFMTAIGGGDARTAFAVGVARADLLGIHPRGPGKLSSLDRALEKLAMLHTHDHQRALAGLEAAMEADGASRQSELEFTEVVRLALARPPVPAAAVAPAPKRSWRSRLRVGASAGS